MDTYEYIDPKTSLETYEWDDIWCEHANDTEKRRVLLIGDSISRQYRGDVNTIANGSFYADNMSTSKALDNPGFITLIDCVLHQLTNYEIIHFNQGLHGFHYTDGEYEVRYEKTVNHILEKYSDKKLVLALSTPVYEKDNITKFAERNSRVVARNNSVIKIAQKYNLKTNDLYSVAQKAPYKNDGVHLLAEGACMLAKQCVKIIKELM